MFNLLFFNFAIGLFKNHCMNKCKQKKNLFIVVGLICSRISIVKSFKYYLHNKRMIVSLLSRKCCHLYYDRRIKRVLRAISRNACQQGVLALQNLLLRNYSVFL